MKKLLFILIISVVVLYPVSQTEIAEAKNSNAETTETNNIKVILKGNQSINDSISTLATSGKPDIYNLVVDVVPLVGGFSVSARMKKGAMAKVNVKIVTTGTKETYSRETGKLKRKGTRTDSYNFTGLNSAFGKKMHFITSPVKTLKPKYKVVVTAFDNGKIANVGTSTGYYKVNPKLYKHWNKGTFKSVPYTVEYHNNKHARDPYVKAENIEVYLKKANKMRSKVKDLKKATSNYKRKVVKGVPAEGKLAYYKYTDKSKTSTRKQFITITQSKKKQILTFGGK